MSQYVEIFANDFCIDELKCICEICKNKFTEYAPSNYELVCFMLESGEKRFLPTYGMYGYLDLLDRLLDDWNKSDRITEVILHKFEEKLQRITPYKAVISQTRCPLCASQNIHVVQKTMRTNLKVKWLEINVDYFNEI